MERIFHLHNYFEKVNKKFKDDRREDSVIEEEERRRLEEEKQKAQQILTNGLNGHSKDYSGETEDEDDDDEDDEDFDINKKDKDDDISEDSDVDSVNYDDQSDKGLQNDAFEEEESDEEDEEFDEEVEHNGDEKNEEMDDIDEIKDLNDDENLNENGTEDSQEGQLNGDGGKDEHLESSPIIKSDNKVVKKVRRKPKKVKLSIKSQQPKSNLVQIDTANVKDIWDGFQKEVQELESQKRQKALQPDQVQQKTRVKRYEFAGETITVQESYSFREKELLKSFEKIERAQKNSFKHEKSWEPPKRRIELPDVLNQLKKSKLSTLTKTKHDWDEYKKDKDIVEELEAHQKSKHSYVEKQAFLERTDHRQYQQEKKVREHQRKIRMQKQFQDVEIA